MTSTLRSPAPHLLDAVRVPVLLERARDLASPPPGGGWRSPLTAARTSRGKTVSALAREVHVSRATISMWEGGVRVPGRHYWPALAAALRLSEAAVGALFPDHRGARHDGVRLPSLGWARRASGLTQRELAMSVGVAPTTLAMWESAKVRVDPGTAEQLARLLRTDPGRLVAAPPAPAPDPRPLRRLRREAGMSQREAAAHLGIAVGTLARYEAGERSAPVAVVRRMAAAYRRPVEELLRHSGREIRPLPVGARWRPEDVPAAILALRTAAGLTKVDFGRVVGRSGQAVRNWESGRTRPVADTCRRLETVFRLPAGKFPA